MEPPMYGSYQDYTTIRNKHYVDRVRMFSKVVDKIRKQDTLLVLIRQSRLYHVGSATNITLSKSKLDIIRTHLPEFKQILHLYYDSVKVITKFDNLILCL